MIYDKAHELARALKDSPEFKKYKTLRLEVNKDEKNKAMLEDYQTKMMDLQLSQIKTGEMDQAKLGELKALEQILVMNSILKDYLMAEMEFSRIYADINKIITEAIEVKE